MQRPRLRLRARAGGGGLLFGTERKTHFSGSLSRKEVGCHYKMFPLSLYTAQKHPDLVTSKREALKLPPACFVEGSGAAVAEAAGDVPVGCVPVVAYLCVCLQIPTIKEKRKERHVWLKNY